MGHRSPGYFHRLNKLLEEINQTKDKTYFSVSLRRTCGVSVCVINPPCLLYLLIIFSLQKKPRSICKAIILYTYEGLEAVDMVNGIQKLSPLGHCLKCSLYWLCMKIITI